LIATTATAKMTLLKHQGKWSSRALKQQATFMAKQCANLVTEGTSGQQGSSNNQNSDGGQQLKTHDRFGNPIDRTPPVCGQPHTKKDSAGKEMHWCGDPSCQCWGNHNTDGHKEWKEKMKARFKKRKEQHQQCQNNQGSNPSESTAGPLMMPRASYNHTAGSDPFNGIPL
jgi:hypothetical protein